MVLNRVAPEVHRVIHIVGLGAQERALLSEPAKAALAQADFLLGSKRQRNCVADVVIGANFQPLPPLAELECWLNAHSDRNIVILSSGDPLFFGIGRWLSERFGTERLVFHPGVSTIQAACHLLGLSLQDLEVVNLHGRPLQRIRAHLRRHRYYAILTDRHSHPYALAQECLAANFPRSRLWVSERLGYPDQKQRLFTAQKLAAIQGCDVAPLFDPLHLTILYTEGEGGVYPEFPGIPDVAFLSGSDSGGGLLTKREVRLAALSLLQPAARQIAWDIGAGCGGISVEWARWNPRGRIYAIEKNARRLEYLCANRDHFGVDANLTVIADSAPRCLAQLPDPDAVFIGGSDGELQGLLQVCWQRLSPGGCLVSSAVTETSRATLNAFADLLEAGSCDGQQIESLQIAISRADKLAGQRLYRPQLPVVLMKFRKANQACNNE